jgi:hypothetical protein
MGNKKNKRLSAPSSAASSTETDTLERILDNDYGVLSDPDEVSDSAKAEAAKVEATEEAMPAAMAEGTTTANTTENTHESPQKKPSSSPQHTPQIPPSSPPEPLHQMSLSLPDLKEETTSLEILKLKLSSDKKFKEKMTLHTFFSFIVMALDIAGRPKSAPAEPTSQSEIMKETIMLVEYLIHNHCVNLYTRTYLQSLFDTSVIQIIIESILQFSNEDPMNFTKLVSDEQEDRSPNTTVNAMAVATAATDIVVTIPAAQEQPSGIRNFFKKLFCCCYGRRKSSGNVTVVKTAEMTSAIETTPENDGLQNQEQPEPSA